ncbi:putative lipase precursor [Podospora australis]|uniref:Lipase n=1 Tax=Podospora australis TaxID=1536484 RepID=A0AAN6WWW2_9PEZI|nr:putative lipase precursor [Podospora australis]
MLLAKSSAVFFGLAVTSVLANPTVTLSKTKVTYRGTTVGSVEHFQNIRFAHDTSGQRRFAPPEPYTPAEGTEVDATAPGAACPQSKAAIPPFFVETPNISEDCLTLRISRPAGTTAKDKLPVVVHLHGGGVVKGSAYDPHFDPDNLLALSVEIDKPIIHVALNYRLTIFGFARLPILKDQKSMNVGMRDQRVGYRWIKDNIAAFGGDPTRITSFGLSAGATFISLHLISYGGKKGVPFTQGWAMSGPPGTGFNMTSDVTELHTRAVGRQLGCPSNQDSELLQCLRQVPFEKLTETAMGYSVNNHPPAGLFTFIPSVDGDIIPDRQSVLYRSGKFVKGIPMVYGWAQDDGAGSTGPASLYQTEESIKKPVKDVAHTITEEDFEKLFSLYPVSDFEPDLAFYEARRQESDPVVPVHYFRAARILRDLMFTCSSIDFGYELSRQSRAINPQFPGTHLYTLNQSMLTPLFAGAGMPYIGATHGSDTNYLYKLFPEGPIAEADEKLSRAMGTSFINFAYRGSPEHKHKKKKKKNDAGLGDWPEAFATQGPGALNLMVIGGPHGTGSAHLTSHKHKTKGKKGDGREEAQVPILGEDMVVGEMANKIDRERKRELEREKLFERCAYINSLSEKLGN